MVSPDKVMVNVVSAAIPATAVVMVKEVAPVLPATAVIVWTDAVPAVLALGVTPEAKNPSGYVKVILPPI